MNKQLRNGLIAAATIMTIAIPLGSTVYAASSRAPVDICMPNCDITDPDITDPDITDPESLVELSWTAPITRTDGELLNLSELVGYKVYYGEDKDNLSSVIPVTDGSTSVSFTIPEPGLYYFAVTAYDYNGLESDFSDIVSKEIP